MRCREPERTRDHNFWVAALIQPLDLGLWWIYGPPRVVMSVAGFPVPAVPHWARARTAAIRPGRVP
ncbi:hypothetical protein GCM10010347_47290 [Streptomyces cirratus]|uniref:Uncharacterized protein n=1 Tax=Streptomyces cirratus TaxID=68187 RepID=A0ABQ3F412_9ACTN|nr:hypothetical protein GCM10010347_47290 [Streptomyces cirratus]